MSDRNPNSRKEGYFQDFKETLSQFMRRTARRELARGELNAGSRDLDEIKRKVREAEEEHDVPSVSKELAENFAEEMREKLLIVDEPSARLLEYLSDRLRQEFPWVKGLVLLGSAAHGGLQLRRFLNNPGHSDLDWAVIVDADASITDRMALNQRGNQIITELNRKDDELVNDLPSDYHGCDVINPVDHYAYDLSQMNVNDLSTIDREYLAPRKLILFFQPTFPKELGEKNQEILLEYLGKLSLTDEEKYENAINALLGQWYDVHKIKPKHLQRSENFSLLAKASFLTSVSSEFIHDPFLQLILSTDKR